MKHNIGNFRRREFTQQLIKCLLIKWKVVYQVLLAQHSYCLHICLLEKKIYADGRVKPSLHSLFPII